MDANNNNSISSIQSTNWSGSIPIELSLAPTSLSSPSMPASIHVLVSRTTFLHIGLQSAVLRLHKYAPVVSFPNLTKRSEPDPGEEEDDSKEQQTPENTTTPDNTTTTYPVCWFEDEETQFALRWHLFVGVLWDMRTTTNKKIPWKIRLHFTQYPSSQILPLNDVLTTVERSFRNSLKQALFLQYNSTKVAMSISKQNHQQLWDSVVRGNHRLYQQVNGDLQSTNVEANLLPVRLFVDGKPPIQRPCRIQQEDENVNPITLGSLLLDWTPDLFAKSDENGESIVPISSDTSWLVQGIHVPLSTNMLELWKTLSCPDHFLYVLLRTKR